MAGTCTRPCGSSPDTERRPPTPLVRVFWTRSGVVCGSSWTRIGPPLVCRGLERLVLPLGRVATTLLVRALSSTGCLLLRSPSLGDGPPSETLLWILHHWKRSHVTDHSDSDLVPPCRLMWDIAATLSQRIRTLFPVTLSLRAVRSLKTANIYSTLMCVPSRSRSHTWDRAAFCACAPHPFSDAYVVTVKEVGGVGNWTPTRRLGSELHHLKIFSRCGAGGIRRDIGLTDSRKNDSRCNCRGIMYSLHHGTCPPDLSGNPVGPARLLLISGGWTPETVCPSGPP